MGNGITLFAQFTRIGLIWSLADIAEDHVVPVPEVGLVAIGTLLIVVVVPTVHEKSYQKCLKLVLLRLQKYTLDTFLRLDMLPLEYSWLSLLYLQSMEKSYQKYAKLILPRLQKHTLYTFLRSDMLSLENSWSLSLYLLISPKKLIMMMTQSLMIWQITRFFNLPWFSVLFIGAEFLPIALSSLCKEFFALPFASPFYGKWANLFCSVYVRWLLS